MPPELKDRVQAAADKASRSMHSEIIHVLEQHYTTTKRVDLGASEAELGNAVAEVMKQNPAAAEDMLKIVKALITGIEAGLAPEEENKPGQTAN